MSQCLRLKCLIAPNSDVGVFSCTKIVTEGLNDPEGVAEGARWTFSLDFNILALQFYWLLNSE